ncbi:hypothetical protein KIPB_008349, partial [Kipferlia bialata]|eukprot:g8349.t1
MSEVPTEGESPAVGDAEVEEGQTETPAVVEEKREAVDTAAEVEGEGGDGVGSPATILSTQEEEDAPAPPEKPEEEREREEVVDVAEDDYAAQPVPGGSLRPGGSSLTRGDSESAPEANWSMSIPDIVKTRLAHITDDLQGLAASMNSLAYEVERRMPRYEFQSLLRPKISKAETDRHLKATNDSLEDLRQHQQHLRGYVDREMAKIRQNIRSVAGSITSNADLYTTVDQLRTQLGSLDSVTVAVRQTLDRNHQTYVGAREKLQTSVTNHTKTINGLTADVSKTGNKLDDTGRRLTEVSAKHTNQLDILQVNVTDARQTVKDASTALGRQLEEAREQAMRYSSDLVARETRERVATLEQFTGMLDTAEQGMTDVRDEVTTIEGNVTAMVTSIRKDCGDAISEARGAMALQVDEAMKRFELLRREVECAVSDQREAMTQLRDFERKVKEISTEWRFAVNALDAREKEDFRAARRRQDELAGKHVESAQMVDARIASLSLEMSAATDAWDEQWQNRVGLVDSRFETQDGVVSKIGSAIGVEAEIRAKKCRHVQEVVKRETTRIARQLDSKAEWDDVRRALWTKADKTEMPMAFSTRSIDTSRGETAFSAPRLATDPALPPGKFAGTQGIL